MRYSIDYSQGNLIGWVATDNLDTEIIVKDSVGREYSTTLGEPRKSVVEKDITRNLNCGFSFEGILPESIEGNFYSIVISTGSDVITTTKFCGDPVVWKDQFDSFEIHDRSDFSCQEPRTLDVFQNNPDLIAFKIIMIRLRRGKRAHAWRGRFQGHSYESIQMDWDFFRGFYEKYFNSINEVLTVRSLWSVVDTFADFGDPLEKACALAVSNYLYQERFAQTGRAIYKLVPLDKMKDDRQILYWGGMKTNRLKADDAYDVFMTRNIEVLSYSLILKKTFGAIFLKSLEAKDSIISMNAENSSHFKKAFEYYKSHFRKTEI